MINYYYELNPDVTVFGRKDLRYLALFDGHPGQGSFNWRLHDEALKHSERVWLENANGVTLIKAPSNDTSWGQVDPHELTWLKLRCHDIEEL
jgi:hypothetical protein